MACILLNSYQMHDGRPSLLVLFWRRWEPSGPVAAFWAGLWEVYGWGGGVYREVKWAN